MFICFLLHSIFLGAEARKVYDEANVLLDQIVDQKLLTARGIAGFYPAQSVGDDIIIYEDLNGVNAGTPLTTLYGLRQQVS